MSRVVHVLWSPQSGPLCAYEDPVLAWTHARTMLGVQVALVDLREELPELARTDMEDEYDGDEATPVGEETVPVPFDDLKDRDDA